MMNLSPLLLEQFCSPTLINDLMSLELSLCTNLNLKLAVFKVNRLAVPDANITISGASHDKCKL